MSPHTNSMVSDLHAVGVNVLALDIVKDSIGSAGVTMVEISLAAVSFGEQAHLALCVYWSSSQGQNRNIDRLIVHVHILFGQPRAARTHQCQDTAPQHCTPVHVHRDGTYLGALAWNRTLDGRREMAAFEEVVRKQSWVAVIAFDAICISGDGTVWWRACVIWRNKVVYMSLVTLALVLVIVGYRTARVIPTTAIAILATDNIYMIKVAGTVSLATNALATALIAVKACGYSTLLVMTVLSIVYYGQLKTVCRYSWYSTRWDPVPSQDRAGRMFTSVAECIFYGCFAPIAAMYPTVIIDIVLVALKRSPIDAGGLSRVYQVHSDRGAGSVDKLEGTLVFHRESTFSSSVGTGDIEVAVAEIRVGAEPRSAALHLQNSYR
ncbi:hypothetical protein V8D89_009835 [Ganoderma adspersum]